MADDDKPLLSKLWPNKGVDWTIMLVMVIALLGGALLSGVVGGMLAWATGQADLSPEWKAVAGVVGYGSALGVGIFLGKKVDKQKRARNQNEPTQHK